MLDIQFIRDNPEVVAEKSKQKGKKVDVPGLLKLDAQRRQLQAQVDELRQTRNAHAGELKKGKPSDSQIATGKKIKDQLNEIEAKLNTADEHFYKQLASVPNMPLDDVPVGQSEADNQVAKTVGEPTKLGFTAKNHAQIAQSKDWLDKERAAKVAGARFAYLKGDLVKLQFAIIQFVMDKLSDQDFIDQVIKENKLGVSNKPFTPVLPPAMIRTEPYQKSGRLNAEEVTYKLADDDLWLNASAEHSLCTMYMDEILEESQLPIRYLGYSTSFRREAGTYGKDMEGMFRMHQFDKLEMESFTAPQDGLQEHLFMIAVQEKIMQLLDIPYHVLMKCTADIGTPNARGVDLEAWLPSQQAYRETHTADYMTDYQARGLRIRLRRPDGRLEFVHTNDATALPLSRGPIAIIENYQTKDGKVRVPKVLQPYMGGKTEL